MRSLAGCLLALFLATACTDPPPPPDTDTDTTPPTFEAARDAAFALHAAGADLDRTRDALLAAHDLRPEAYGVNTLLGQVCRQLGRSGEAIDHFGRAYAARPDDVLTAAALGRLLMQEGRHVEALVPLQAALAQAPDDRAILKGLADACWRLDRTDEARHWQEVLGLMLALDDNAFTRTRTGADMQAKKQEAVERSDYVRREVEQHRERLQRLTGIHPVFGDGFLLLADMQRGAGEVEEACRTIEAYLAQHGGSLPPGERDALLERHCGGLR